MISQGQGLACRKQHRDVSDAVELKVKGRIEILDIKKKITFIYRLMQKLLSWYFYIFLLFFY